MPAKGFKEGVDEFFWSYTDEPHASRRKAMLRDYPEIKKLEGHDPATKWWAALAIGVQIAIALRVQYWSWPWFFVFAYVVGGTITQYLTLVIHEISHNLLFKSPLYNKLFGFVANIPLLFGYSYTFRRYHLDHHKWQGEVEVDMDVPTQLEGKVVGTSRVMKALWVFFQFLFYALRPPLMKPLPISRWEVYNWAFNLTADAVLYYYGGWRALAYCFTSMFLGLGAHVMSGHFIAEHYVFTPGTETYSYYGPLNILACNVGLHVAHHDFPRVPGSRLHALEAMAPEYYATLPQYNSWALVLWRYVTDYSVGPFSRVIRRSKKVK